MSVIEGPTYIFEKQIKKYGGPIGNDGYILVIMKICLPILNLYSTEYENTEKKVAYDDTLHIDFYSTILQCEIFTLIGQITESWASSVGDTNPICSIL